MALPVGLALVASGLLLLARVLLSRRPLRARVSASLTRGMAHTRPDAAPPGARAPGALGTWSRRMTPPGWVSRVQGLLARAGHPPAWPLERVLVAKVVLAAAAGGLMLLYVSAQPGPGRVLLMATSTALAFFAPELLLHSRAQERQEQIGLELADTLDQMTIAVEAGLAFDAAVARVGRNGKGPLAQELVRTLQDIQVGVSRRDAFRALAERNHVPDLRRFVSALLQADAYGISIGSVLRTQAREMRIKRRQLAEGKAMQIPVKVIFPLVLCILPVLFIVLLGPAAVDMVRAFGGGP